MALINEPTNGVDKSFHKPVIYLFFNPMTPVPPVFTVTSIGLCSTSDVITVIKIGITCTQVLQEVLHYMNLIHFKILISVCACLTKNVIKCDARGKKGMLSLLACKCLFE